MFELLAAAVFQIATLLGSPATTTTQPTTNTSFATATTTTPPPPVKTIGNTGWDND